MSTQKNFRTSELARAAGVHPNTVRLYEQWGLIPPVERTPSGYRIFHQPHLDCLKLARKIYSAPYPGRGFRAMGTEIIQCAVADNWSAALEKAQVHLSAVEAELERAEAAADLLEHWAQHMTEATDDPPLSIGEVARLLGVSVDIVRNAERNGLITVPRNLYNGYRLFRKREIERLQIIRMLTRAGYSHMAILRMFLELDAGNTRNLKKVLDTPRADEDIFTVADRWLTTLQVQKKMAQEVVGMIAKVIAAGEKIQDAS